MKDRQLCAQVREALELVLGGSEDDVLLALAVVDVRPDPDASRLCVFLEAPADLDLDRARDHLAAATPLLRHEIAGSIHRKRTPTLTYQVLPQGPFAAPSEEAEAE